MLSRSVVAFVLAAALVAACGSSSPSQGPGAGPTQGPGATSDAGPGPTPVGNGGNGNTGGGGTRGVCDLVTTAELEGIFGVSGVTTEVIAGPPDTCDVQADGAPIAALVLVTSGANAMFDAWAGSGQLFGGIGDKAAYVPDSALFIVLKGSTVVSIAILSSLDTEEERLELMKEIAGIAAGRL